MPQKNLKPPDILDDNVQVNKPPDIADDEPIGDPYTGPDTFMEGLMNSGSDVMDAMGKGATGFMKGATIDIPSTIYHGAKNAVMHPLDTLLGSMGPLGDMISGRDSMAGLRDATAHAGSDPEAFGRILGQMAGQPAVTAGIAKGAPPVTRALGTPVEATGRMIKNYQPLTGLPVISPFAGRTARTLESLAGRGIEALGRRMKGSPAPLEGEIMPPMEPAFNEGAYSEVPPYQELPPSETSFYAPETNPVPPLELPPGQQMLELPPSNVHYGGPGNLPNPTLLEGMPQQAQLPPATTRIQGPGENPPNFEYTGRRSSPAVPEQKPKVRMNSEGNMVDMQTGQVHSPSGEVLSYPTKISEIMQKSFADMSYDELQTLSRMNLDKNVMQTIKRELGKRVGPTRNSPFFYKNRK